MGKETVPSKKGPSVTFWGQSRLQLLVGIWPWDSCEGVSGRVLGLEWKGLVSSPRPLSDQLCSLGQAPQPL